MEEGARPKLQGVFAPEAQGALSLATWRAIQSDTRRLLTVQPRSALLELRQARMRLGLS